MKIKREKEINKIRIEHNKKLLWAILVLIVILIFLIIYIREEINKKNNKGDGFECSVDSDCVKQSLTCCPCNSGGKEACVSMENLTKITKELASCPDNLMCAFIYNCKIKSCKCDNGKCIEIE